MGTISKTMSYLFPRRGVESKEANRREHNRLDGKNMEACLNGETFKVVNWSQSGLLLEPSNNNNYISNTPDLTLKLSHGNNVISLMHTGHVLKSDKKGIVITLNPLNKLLKKQFSLMIDAALAESFLHSQIK